MFSRFAVVLLAIFAAFGAGRGQAQEITLTFSHFLGPKSFFQVDVAEPLPPSLPPRPMER